mmetsp:Transcript_12993/g.51827  ORF Transcript_12993/g.51827 Transcript_12993/m.51827 type:complete len:230 (+) Transcript_12993:3123-3812(+)
MFRGRRTGRCTCGCSTTTTPLRRCARPTPRRWAASASTPAAPSSLYPTSAAMSPSGASPTRTSSGSPTYRYTRTRSGPTTWRSATRAPSSRRAASRRAERIFPSGMRCCRRRGRGYIPSHATRTAAQWQCSTLAGTKPSSQAERRERYASSTSASDRSSTRRRLRTLAPFMRSPSTGRRAPSCLELPTQSSRSGPCPCSPRLRFGRESTRSRDSAPRCSCRPPPPAAKA